MPPFSPGTSVLLRCLSPSDPVPAVPDNYRHLGSHIPGALVRPDARLRPYGRGLLRPFRPLFRSEKEGKSGLGRFTVGFSGVRGDNLEPMKHSICIYLSRFYTTEEDPVGTGVGLPSLPCSILMAPLISALVHARPGRLDPKRTRWYSATAQHDKKGGGSSLCRSARLSSLRSLILTVHRHSNGSSWTPVPSIVVSSFGAPGTLNADPH